MSKMAIDEELAAIGLNNLGNVMLNLSPERLVEEALRRQEGILTETGAFRVETGKYTGRSPKDRFIVANEATNDKVAWGKVNVPIEQDKFDAIYQSALTYLQGKDIYVFDGLAGADSKYQVSVRIVNELAHQNLFMHQLLVRPTTEQLEVYQPEFTMVCAPGYHCDPERDGVNSEAAIIIDFSKKIILIVGSSYCGEMKKSIFSVMNFILPQKDILSMHCSANMSPEDHSVALFFGLSGTGKTTLSADPKRMLIGDDEHAWTADGVFNIEGGCYAKAIRLNREQEPQIFDAVRFGALVENVQFVPGTRTIDFYDDSLTENTRAAYPVNYIPNAQLDGQGGIPKTVVFLTADAFGVLPPISKLNKEQAMYHLLSGYTSKLAGTERGITEPQATFSACFGEPFLPLPAVKYAEMLGERIEKYDVEVFLINTGWIGGPYGVGERIPLKYTRAIVTAALGGELRHIAYEEHPIFKVSMPTSCPEVDSRLLNPINLWEDKDAYLQQAKMLAKKFEDNFSRFHEMPDHIKNAGPKAE